MSDAHTLAPLQVLVLDDDPLIRQSLKRLLRLLGAEVTLAEDAAEALALGQRRVFDLLVTEIELGRPPNGVETARQLLSRRRVRKAVFLSAQQDVERFLQAIILGHYVEKGHPLAFDRLKAIVEKLQDERAEP